MDDEPALFTLVRRILQKGGYAVMGAGDPETALQLVAASADSIDLVVTDMFMPTMTGAELARHVRERRPGVKVLLMSGQLPDVDPADDAAAFQVLQKPFSAAVLLDRVRAVLDEPAAG